MVFQDGTFHDMLISIYFQKLGFVVATRVNLNFQEVQINLSACILLFNFYTVIWNLGWVNTIYIQCSRSNF